jgi:steroid delta-isomerase-like uncharacterized protein
MSPQDSINTVRSAYRAYNERDFDDIASLYAEELELENVATGDQLRGREGYLQHVRGWAAAFPDSRIEVVSVAEAGEGVTVEYVFRGTHTGTLIGTHGHIPPTWAQVEQRFCDVLELRDLRIHRVRSYFDTGSLFRQMGLFPNSPLHGPDRRASLDLYALDTDASPQQRNRAVVQRLIDTVINQHNPAAAAEVCLPNLSWHGGPMGELRDLASYQQLLASLFSSFHDLRVEVEDTVAEADRVAARLSLHGVHCGDFQGVPPTGRTVTGVGTSTFRIVNGKIAEEWWHHDLLGVMRQLDAMPAMVRFSSVGEG